MMHCTLMYSINKKSGAPGPFNKRSLNGLWSSPFPLSGFEDIGVAYYFPCKNHRQSDVRVYVINSIMVSSPMAHVRVKGQYALMVHIEQTESSQSFHFAVRELYRATCIARALPEATAG